MDMNDKAVEYVAGRLLKQWFPHNNFSPREEWEEAAKEDAVTAIQAYLEYTSDDHK